MLLTRPETQPPKVINLFAHEKYYMSRNHESDPIELSPKEQNKADLEEIIRFWVHKGLRTPREYRAVEVYLEAKTQFKSIILGRHPHVPKLFKDQIIRSIINFHLAATDPKFRPAKKYLLKKLSIVEFIWDSWNKQSQLSIHLEPPKTIELEINSNLTKEIIKQYNAIKWGFTNINDLSIVTAEMPAFVRASNRLMKYLKEVEPNLQPLMDLSVKYPHRAAYGLAQANNIDRENFTPFWLASDISIANLDRWLKNQGYFKQTSLRHA
jgi:hypothetical protein